MNTGNDQDIQPISTRDEILEKYYREVRKLPVNSLKEEADLLKRAREGDQKAVEKLVKANLKFVIRIARQYMHFGIPLNDLINEGNIGLIKAIELFDDTKETRLITYAVYWIRQYILKSVSGESSLISVPQNKYWEFLRHKKEINKFEQEHQRAPYSEELSGLFHNNGEDVKEFLGMQKCLGTYEELITDEDKESRIADGCGTAENQITDDLQMESLSIELNTILVNHLKREEKEVIILSFGIGNPAAYTIHEIAQKLGMTSAKARRLRESGIRRLRHSAVNGSLREYIGA